MWEVHKAMKAADDPVAAFYKEESQPAETDTIAYTLRKKGPKTLKEGFQGYIEPIPANRGIVVVPVGMTPQPRTFEKTPLDSLYDAYADEQDLFELDESAATVEVREERLPDYGAALGNFDAEIKDIPWDSDNKDYFQDEVVWGYVSQEASKSIFMKAYHQALFADTSNILEGDAGPQYHSPLLGVDVNDPTAAMAVQGFEMIFGAVGGELIEKGKDKAKDAAGNAAKKLSKNLEKKLGGKVGAVLKDMAAKNAVKMKSAVGKALKGLKPSVKAKLGAGRVKAFLGKIATRIKNFFIARLKKFITKFIIKSAVIKGVSAALIATATAATVATLGIMSWLLALVTAMVTVINVILGVMDTIMAVIMVVLPPILEQVLDSEGFCPDGFKPIDVLIPEAAYFMITTFIPLGDILDLVAPYLCFGDRAPHVIGKQKIVSQPYYEDTTLSLYHRSAGPAEEPRGSTTKRVERKIPAGFVCPAGMDRCYGPCPVGTKALTDADLVCWQDSYGRGVGRLPDIRECSFFGSGMRDDGVSCWEDWRGLGGGQCSGGNCWGGEYNPIQCEPCKAGTYPLGLFCVKDSYGRGAGYGARTAPCSDFGDRRDDGTVCWGKSGEVCGDNCAAGWDHCKHRWWNGGHCNGWHWARCNSWGRHECTGGCRTTCSPVYLGSRIELEQRLRCNGNDDREALLCYPQCRSGYSGKGPVCWSNESEYRRRCWGGTVNPIQCAPIRCEPIFNKGGCGCIKKNLFDRQFCRPDEEMNAALCYRRCNPGYTGIGPVCWSNEKTQGRPTMAKGTDLVYDPGYNPPPIDQLKFAWCNYASPTMMDRMSQFYYDQAMLNQVQTDDGRVEVSYIATFYGVIASSELTCDVVCAMRTVRFEPYTGARYEEIVGTSYKDDPDNKDNLFSYRRFYFTKLPTDPQGVFTVTGCTNNDYTAPDAMVPSFNPEGSNYVPSVPKVFEVTEKKKSAVNKALSALAGIAMGAAAAGAGSVGGKMGGRRGGKTKTEFGPNGDKTVTRMVNERGAMIGGLVAGFAAAQAQNAVGPAIAEMDSQLAKLDAQLANRPADGETEEYLAGSSRTGIMLFTNNDNFFINRGLIYEQSTGFVPNINFCARVQTTNSMCTYRYNLRDAINKYHAETSNRRITTIDLVEPRGRDGCYFKWREVSYDPATNQRGLVTADKEIVLKYEIADDATCTFVPTTFTTDLTPYPIRRVAIPQTNPVEFIHPTRKVVPPATAGGQPTLLPLFPKKPWTIPVALPPTTTLGGPKCPTRKCENKEQIDKLVTDFNAAQPARKILKVLKGWTPRADRCDYEVEMMRINSAGKKVMAKETVSMTVREVAGTACLFERTADGSEALNSGTFIQANTPLLAGDASGGVFSFSSLVAGVRNTMSSVISPLLKLDLEKNLKDPVLKSNTAVTTVYDTVINNQELQGCPSVKCSDPAILDAIIARYNEDNAPNAEEGGEGNTMRRILKAGISGPNSCDILFENLYEQYEDVLYDPTESTVGTKVFRFKLENAGACKFRVAAGADAVTDISNSSPVLRSEMTGLSQPYSQKGCAVKCRDAGILASVKAALEKKYVTKDYIPVYKTILQSFSPNPTTCEYKVLKDVSQRDLSTRQFEESSDIETFVRVTFNMNAAACSFTINNLYEVVEDELDYRPDPRTGEDVPFVKGEAIKLPALFEYDDTNPSARVNSEPQQIS